MAKGRFERRALLRASMASGLVLATTAIRPLRPHRRAALGAAAAVGAAQESAVAGAVVALSSVAAEVSRRKGWRVTAVGAAIGAAIALATRRLWPVAPKTAAAIRPAFTPAGGEPTEDGDGLTFVVNPSAGPSITDAPTETLQKSFPRAVVIELGGEHDLESALATAAASAKAIGVAGGDGSVGSAAEVAHTAGKPLVVVPAGTLNHLARDLGIHSVDDAVEAVKEGDLVAVDVASIDGQTFLNTASFGVYSELVDARERLEAKIGKWPALLVALFRVLRTYQPIEVELDGQRRRLWMIFIGNCRYHPAGFAPSWRERLDDGVLDVRIVDADHPGARTRLLFAVLTGRLGRCRVYEAMTTEKLHVKVLDESDVRLARDGETFDGDADFVICKEKQPLAVYVKRELRATE